MSEPSKNPERLLDPSANEAFQGLVADLRETLLSEAQRTSVGGRITDDDLLLAYKRLSYPTKESLQFSDAQSVISQALKENRIIEWVSYVMAVILFVFGLILLSVGAVSSDVATRAGCLFGGSVVELLILVPFRFAINSRRHNIALRMLGLIINRVDDPKRLAPLLKDTFLSVVLGNAQFSVTREQ
jgi:hypothetical protein